MITGVVLSLIWGIVKGPLGYVPDLNINYDGIVNSTVFQYLRAALYLFPMDTVHSIFAITAALWVLRVFIAFFRSLWASLPIV